MKKVLILLACALLVASLFFIQKKPTTVKEKETPNLFAIVIKYFPFSAENSLREWEEKILKGRVVYRIEKAGDLESYVRAKSKKAASALYYKMKLDINKGLLVSWKWHVDEFPKKSMPEEISLRSEEDFAARIYVIFPAIFFTHSKAIEYIWAESLPEGSKGTSAYSKNIKILVLRSGTYKEAWLFECRDIYKDYLELFGEKPRLDIGAIAFMTDADSTKTDASAIYDEINVGYMKKRSE